MISWALLVGHGSGSNTPKRRRSVPQRSPSSLGLAGRWLGHFDARQVYDLPIIAPYFFSGLRPHGHRPLNHGKARSASRRLAAHRSGRAIEANILALLLD